MEAKSVINNARGIFATTTTSGILMGLVIEYMSFKAGCLSFDFRVTWINYRRVTGIVSLNDGSVFYESETYGLFDHVTEH